MSKNYPQHKDIKITRNKHSLKKLSIKMASRSTTRDNTLSESI